MAKFRIRNGGYVFIDEKGVPTKLSVIDDSHPMFASQRHKFDSSPVSEAEADLAEKAAAITVTAGADYSKLKRPKLIDHYRAIFDRDPPEGVTVSWLREKLEAADRGEFDEEDEDSDETSE